MSKIIWLEDEITISAKDNDAMVIITNRATCIMFPEDFCEPKIVNKTMFKVGWLDWMEVHVLQ